MSIIPDFYTVVKGTGKTNIEMQGLPYAHWDRRSLSYLAKVYTKDLKSREAYASICRLIRLYPSSSKEEIYKVWQNKPGTI